MQIYIKENDTRWLLNQIKDEVTVMRDKELVYKVTGEPDLSFKEGRSCLYDIIDKYNNGTLDVLDDCGEEIETIEEEEIETTEGEEIEVQVKAPEPHPCLFCGEVPSFITINSASGSHYVQNRVLACKCGRIMISGATFDVMDKEPIEFRMVKEYNSRMPLRKAN